MKVFLTALILLSTLTSVNEPGNSNGPTLSSLVNDAVIIWYLDADADGYWVLSRIAKLSPGPGWTRTQPAGGQGDCNDDDPTVHTLISYYPDNDGDGFGSMILNTSVSFCSSKAPSGFSENHLDCDDTNPTILGPTTLYRDADGDGYGTSGVSILTCPSVTPIGYVSNNLDCNDTNPNIKGPVTWYKDSDGDGYGTPDISVQYCPITVPVGYVMNNLDCNDGNAAINPATEWFKDADNDQYYAGNAVRQCTSPGTGFRRNGLTGGGDCNDANAAVNPGATETCGDAVDNNCNGQTDEGNIVINLNPGTGTYSICRGSSMFLAAVSPTAVSYQWMKGRQDLVGETRNTLTVTKAGDYRVRVTDALNCTATAGLYTIKLVTCASGAIVESTARDTDKAPREIEISNELVGVRVLTNPTSHEFTLMLTNFNDKGNASILLRNSILQIIQQPKNIGGRSFSFGKDLKPGIYYAEIRRGNKRTTIKLVKL